jgi:Protein of unknown function (DUF2934)
MPPNKVPCRLVMPQPRKPTTKTDEKPFELATVEEPSSVAQSDLTSLSAALEHEKIAVLAHRYWHERGSPEGSADDDWLRAEQDIHKQSEVDPRFDRAPLRLTH